MATQEPFVTIRQRIVKSPSKPSSVNISADMDATMSTPSDRFVRKMMYHPPTWISLWFAVSSVLVTWDFLYCFLRPRSMEGGDLFWFWSPYKLYGTIDHIYGPKALESNNGFTNAQAFLNVIETMLNIEYLYLAHSSPSTLPSTTANHGGRRKKGHPTAPLIGFTAAVMTLSKTVLYHLQEYYCGWCSIGHNEFKTLFWLWIIPNGLWIVFPFLVASTLGATIATSLRNHARDMAIEEEALCAAFPALLGKDAAKTFKRTDDAGGPK